MGLLSPSGRCLGWNEACMMLTSVVCSTGGYIICCQTLGSAVLGLIRHICHIYHMSFAKL